MDGKLLFHCIPHAGLILFLVGVLNLYTRKWDSSNYPRETSLSVWLALAMTSFLVTSRVSLLWLLRLYKYEQIHPATWYLIVLILLQAPCISNGVHLLWNTPIISAASRETLPKKSRMALGVLSSILEGMATSIFATEVAHVLPEPVLLTLPYSILACVLLKNALKDSQVQALKVSDASCLSLILDPVSKFVFLILACHTLWTPTAVAVVLCLWSQFRLSAEGCIVLITCLLLLSLTWSPAVQTMIVSNETGVRCRAIDLLYIPVKAIAVALSLFMSLFFKLDDFRTYMIDCVTLAFREFSDIRVWLPVFICCLGAFFSLMSTAAASKMCLMKAGVQVPMFLCPVLSIFVTTVVWKDFETQAFRELAGEDLYSWIAIGISTVAWLIPFLVPGLDGFSNPSVCGRQFTEIFHSFSWSCFFLEPRLILIYDPRMISINRCSLSSQQTTRSRNKHVYICTTMYKESATEMKRYLGSVKNVFTNNLNEALTLEAHIFFDSSVEKDKINRRGQHLISLLCDTFQQESGDLEKLATPYGCQIRAKTPENYPVYVHFKDATKVKAKKRWSQVMYMHYILQFRTMYMKQQSRDSRFLIQSQSMEQCKEEYNRDIFLVGNYTSFPTSVMTNSFCTDVKYPPTKCHCTSIPTPRNIDCMHLTSPSESTRPYGDVSDTTNCYCNACNSSNTSVRGTGAADRTCNNSNKLLEPANSFNFNEDLELGKHTERLGQMYSRSVKPFSSTDESCANCSNSSDVCSIYTSADLNNSLEDFSKPGRRSSCQYAPSLLDDVFFVTTDADTEFSARSIRHLLERCESEPGLGAVCGRTVPIGSAKPIVWYQKFEYAKDFWLVKSSQNVIGSVTCCPGCFSIYRGSAVASIADKFSQPAGSAFDSLVMDHGEDRWLCTLLMQGGWRLAYTFQGCNSTHCPETVGEFLRQRRRWVLSELANMLAIFMSVPSLVKNNSAFSGMFLFSLFTTFLWVILSPSTTLVFMSAGLDVLFSVSLIITLPISVMLFIGYCSICCLANQRTQKLVSLTVTFAMALSVVTLGVGFIIYVAKAVERDINTWGCVQFQPYFLVFILVICIVYAAVLHPRESFSLVYGLAYALIFPAMFVILPGYAIANMFDQSWGTRESGSHGCCQEPEEEEHDDTLSDFTIAVSSLPSLACCNHEEEVFWKYLTSKYIGTDVNNRKPSVFLCNDLLRLRRLSVLIFVTVNLIWFCCLSALYVLAKSNVICYFVAAILSFSLVVQLIGLTCYKCNIILNTYFLSKTNVFVPRTLSD